MAAIRSLVHPRDEIMQTMERIYRYRMTTTSGGNLSIRDGERNIWITPARIDKGSLTRDDIVCVRPDGSVDGKHRPSSEFPFHRAIYDAREDIHGVVHAHPVALVAFSICRQTPNTRLFHQAHHMCGQVGFAPYALPGSQTLGDNIAAQFAHRCDSVILENHGVVVGGDTLAQAFQRFEAFEFASKTIIKASHLGPIRYLSDSQLHLAQQRTHSVGTLNPPTVTAHEQELRKRLVDFLKRGCRQRLLISTEGSFSARVDRDSFLITPSQRDRELLTIDDLVLVRDGNHEPGSLPSRAVRQHAAIYRNHPEVQAIVFAHPVNATAFSITAAPLDARTIPESYLFLRDVARIPYGVQLGVGEPTLDRLIGMKTPAGIVENDGVVVVGESILDAFDRLEVLEATAEAIINARCVGEIAPMESEHIAELKRAFGIGE
ncbi:MAG: class II aldolase/adducin family protein [Pirellula sp.]